MSDKEIKFPSIREDGLQLEEHRRFQERFWTVERWVWVGFGAIIILALLGLTGSGGPLARTSASLEGASIDYPRFTRWEAPDEILVEFEPGGAERRLTLSSDFAETFQLESVQPQPDRSETSADGEIMIFRVEPQSAAQVTLHVRAQNPGMADFRAAIDEGAPVSVSTFIFP